MGQAMRTSFEQETGARRSPGLDAIPTGTQLCPSTAMPKALCCSIRSWQHPLFPSVPTAGAPGKPLCLLEVQGVGRAALQDALDVLLKGMLRLGHDAQRGHGQVLVLAGAQQGRGRRVHSAPGTQQHKGEQSGHSN